MFEERIKKALDFKNGDSFFQKLVDILKFKDDAEGMVILLGTKENCEGLNQFINLHPDVTIDYLWQKAISISK